MDNGAISIKSNIFSIFVLCSIINLDSKSNGPPTRRLNNPSIISLCEREESSKPSFKRLKVSSGLSSDECKIVVRSSWAGNVSFVEVLYKHFLHIINIFKL